MELKPLITYNHFPGRLKGGDCCGDGVIVMPLLQGDDLALRSDRALGDLGSNMSPPATGAATPSWCWGRTRAATVAASDSCCCRGWAAPPSPRCYWAAAASSCRGSRAMAWGWGEPGAAAVAAAASSASNDGRSAAASDPCCRAAAASLSAAPGRWPGVGESPGPLQWPQRPCPPPTTGDRPWCGLLEMGAVVARSCCCWRAPVSPSVPRRLANGLGCCGGLVRLSPSPRPTPRRPPGVGVGQWQPHWLRPTLAVVVDGLCPPRRGAAASFGGGRVLRRRRHHHAVAAGRRLGFAE